MNAARILVTGGGGYLGSQVIAALVQRRPMDRGGSITANVTANSDCIVSLDVREMPAARRLPGVIHAAADIRDPALVGLLREHQIDTVVHLAAIVTPGKKPTAISSTRSMSKARATCCRHASARAFAMW